MKKQKSSIIKLSCSESSGDEREKALPKIDKEELRKYLQNSDEEDETPEKTSPQVKKKFKKKTSSGIKVDKDKPKNLIQKDSPQKYLLQGDDFKRLQKKAKKLGTVSCDILKEKIINIWLNTIIKRFTSVLPILKIT